MCYKIRYPKKRSAKTGGKVLTRQTGRAAYVYRCPECEGWHVTTTPWLGKEANRTKFDIAA